MKKTSLYILACITVITSCKQEYTDQNVEETGVVEVKAIPPAEINAAPPTITSGVVTSESRTNMSFKIPGIIQSTLLEEGDAFNSGQLLAKLDLEEINAKTQKAQLGVDKAIRDLKRVESLYADSSATLEQLQNAQTALEVAQTDLEIAQFNQKHAEIKAPFNGYVISKRAEQGEMIAAGTPIYIVAKKGTKNSQIIEVDLSDVELNTTSLGDSCKVSFRNLNNKQYHGVVSKIAESTNPYTGTFKAEITLKKFYPELKQGMYAEVSIFNNHSEKLIEIPMSAIVQGESNAATLFITINGIAHERNIEINQFLNNSFLAKRDQFNSNELIITEGSGYLREADSVIVKSHK